MTSLWHSLPAIRSRYSGEPRLVFADGREDVVPPPLGSRCFRCAQSMSGSTTNAWSEICVNCRVGRFLRVPERKYLERGE